MEYEPERRKIGYVRVSTDDQDPSMQIDALVKFGVKPVHIFTEHASGKNMERQVLKRVFRSMREEDTIVVWKLDRLGRTLKGVIEVLEMLAQRKVHFVSLTESFDTSTPMGKAFLQFAMVMAELERNLISERTKAGIAVAKTRGVRFGRDRLILDNEKRMDKLRKMDRDGLLRDQNDDPIIQARDLMSILNGPEFGKKIQNPETVRRWWRPPNPWAGLDVDAEDVPLNELDDEQEPDDDD